MTAHRHIRTDRGADTI